MGSSDLESRAPLLHSPPPPSSKVRVLSLAISMGLVLVVVAVVAGLAYTNPGLISGLDLHPEQKKVAADREDGGELQRNYPWTNEMLSWQRTGFHFQPDKYFQSDPNAPMYYKGWYHFFYQYNPNGSYWDYSISWGHAVSRDLIHWLVLPIAMKPDHWYDIKGTWTGTATLLPDGHIVVLYTGGTQELVQVQNLAVPADPNDPLLLKWNKYNANPILHPPPGIGDRDFRDPFPVWYNTSTKTWRVLIGSKNADYYGIVLLYDTQDFMNYTLLPHLLHATADKVGMLECVDFYPVATAGRQAGNALQLEEVASGSNKEVKYVMKASMDDERHDYYAIGTFDLASFTFTPDDDTIDVGVGLRYDWGKFYASKTFYDPVKQRRVLWGYIGETDTKEDDIMKGWANLQNIPRTVLFDVKTGSNLLFWPVEEVEKLRSKQIGFSHIKLDAGSKHELSVGEAAQLDIEAEFEINKEALEGTVDADVTYNCSTSGGASNRGQLGPFGVITLANKELSEMTTTYFYVTRRLDGSLRTHFCQDELRSSKATDVFKRVVGNVVPVLDGETFKLRMLVDHSIVESFAQGGRAVATSRVYPTEAVFKSARVFIFNNATDASVTAKTVKIWHMNSTYTHAFEFPSIAETQLPQA